MGPEELLRAACELSYTVARDGVESLPRIDAPPSMQSFLYVARLPPRALIVAQQAIEEDPSFRRRVAERASEEEVGRAGFLWLHRPIGWAAEFEELTAEGADNADGAASAPRLMANGSESSADSAVAALGTFDTRAMPEPPVEEEPGQESTNPVAADAVAVEAVSAIGIDADLIDEELDEFDEVARAVSETAGTSGTSGSFGSVDVFGNGAHSLGLSTPAAPARSEANAIEDELLTLRGLVDRLSHERKAVSGSVRQAEQDLAKARYQPSVFETDVYTLQSELEAARAELEDARAERDNAIRQHSDALTRQLELERELDRARELRADIEREHAEADASFVDVKEALARAETSLSAATADRDELTADLQSVRNENENLKLELARANDAATNQTRALEAQYKAAQTEVDGLKVDKDAMAARLAGIENDLDSARNQLSQVSGHAAEAKSLVDALTEEKIDLASRLADTEAMLETTRTQLAAVRSDADTLTGDLATTRGHRDALASQVEELHANLTDALADLGRLRSTSDADRAALKEIRGERDLLRVRVGSLEQIEKGLEAKLTNLAADRDAVMVRLEQAKAELLDKDRANAALDDEKNQVSATLASVEESREAITAERDRLQADFDAVRARAAELELARDGLSVQVEQLTEENLSIQAQMVERERQQQESAENQGRALSELAHRLSMIENERNAIESDLRETEEQLAEALEAVERSMETAEKARQEKAAAVEAMKAAEFAAAAARAAAPSVDPSLLIQPDEPGTIPSASPLSPVNPVAPIAAVAAEASEAAAPPEFAATTAWPAPDSGAATTTTDTTTTDTDPTADADTAIESSIDTVIDTTIGTGTTVGADTTTVADIREPAPAVAEIIDAAVPSRSEERGARRGWGFGARFRNDQDAGASPVEHAEADLAGSGTDHGAVTDAEVSPVAPAAGVPSPGFAYPVVDPPVPPADPDQSFLPGIDLAPGEPDLDLDSISSELAQAVEHVGFATPDEDEDLDEISKLIKQTVTDFDPSSIQDLEPDVPADRAGAIGDWDSATSGPTTGSPTSSNPLAPPSVFNGGEHFPAAVDPDPTIVVRGGPVDAPHQAFEAGALASDDVWGVSSPRVGRRQIQIPQGIEDEVEIARQVVASPDVVLLVDGDSVARLGWPSLPVAQQRDALVSYLADLSSSTGASPDVVFDGRIGEEESLPASRSVRIRLSTPPTEPTAALDELVDAYPEQWPIAVVTDDDALARSAQVRGATVLNNGQLLDLFIV